MESKPPLVSRNLNECLTPCIPAGVNFIHPFTINGMTFKNNVCAIAPILGDDGDAKWADDCSLEDNETHSLPDVSKNLMLSFNFNPSEFLRTVYDINSLEEAIYWSTDHEDYPAPTVIRIQDSAWMVYGKKSNITEAVVNYYHKVATTQWIESYVFRLQNEKSFAIEGDLKTILVDRYLTKSFIATSLKKFTERIENIKIYEYYRALNWFIYDAMLNKMNGKSIE